jgi:hypothetical protein
VSNGDSRWTDYLNRIGSELGVNLSEREHTSRVTVPLRDGYQADIVVASFAIAKSLGPPAALGA